MSGKILYGGQSLPKYNYKGLGQFFFQSAQKHGSRICQLEADTGLEETFTNVKHRTVRTAIELKHRGIEQSDFILICSNNNPNNAIPFLAGLYLGAKVTSIDPGLAVRDTTHAISVVKPRYIFVEEYAVTTVEKSLEQAGLESEIVVFGDKGSHSGFDEFQRESEEEDGFEPVEVEDCKETAIVLFSSGTSGLPKGICLSHNAFLPTDIDVNKAMEPFGILYFSPLYWLSAMCVLSMSFTFGAYRVITPKFHAEKCFEIIEKYKIQCLFFSPVLAHQLVIFESAEKYDTSSIAFVMLAGAGISDSDMEKLRKLFNRGFVALLFAATEAGGAIATFDRQRDAEVYKRKTGSSGRVALGVHVKIIDTETGAILGPNQRGEILLKSDFQMNGYLNQDSSTAFDEDGFYKTGDIGYYDEEEFVYVVDRLKEIFKYQAWQIVPSVLEAVLREHPAVNEAVVFDIPHEIDGGLPTACVTLKENKEVTVEELDKFVTERVTDTQRLRGGIRIVEQLLKTPTGKVLRRKMKEQFMSQN